MAVVTTDPHSYGRGNVEAPAYRAAAVTPSDGNDLPVVSRGVYVGGGGDLTVVTGAGDPATFKAVPAGSIIPIAVKTILNTGTTATNIVVLW